MGASEYSEYSEYSRGTHKCTSRFMLNYCEVLCENNFDCYVDDSGNGTGTALTQRCLAGTIMCETLTEVTSPV